ncbi:hypothetical protein OIU78_012300 [Salix suchowensis]|nr:hypothetical protein OIU78_012300 [Salix suchowensis]
MDAQKSSQTKLTRTQSSLRSSPTIRSSIHSLTSVAEEDVIKAQQQQQQQQQQKLEDDLEEQKKTKPGRCGSTPRRTGSTRFTAVFTMVSLLFFTFFSLSFLFFFYLRREEIPTSENLLLALIFIAITLFFASKNKNLINQNIIVFKQLWEENTKRLHLCTSRTKSRQVQWFIGDPNVNNRDKDKKLERRIIREGVEFYSNGDFYEGEFHKGKCNGSGVYNFFVNGRYEGDWVDGRYDGDSYAGEWFNGQSHGVGVQTCADGSCYVGEFKCAVKHGLGVYHFRNGDRYAGEYFGDKMHGFGIYHFANGHCYEGSWHEGRKQGYGMYTFRGGDTRSWERFRSSHTLLLVDCFNLQSARRTAENAIHLRRVDELVNKAVHAANRAATAARVAAVKAVQNRIDGKFCDTNV